jgi:hypothetical protein
MELDYSERAAPLLRRTLRQSAFDSPRSSTASHGQPASVPDFDIFEWWPHFQCCHKYFLDHAQHSDHVQAVAAFINIVLPYQRQPYPVASSSSSSLPAAASVGASSARSNGFSPEDGAGHARSVSLIPYIRRLVATGFDNQTVLHGFFGDSWKAGIGPLHQVERRNYLFAAKSSSWLEVKAEYDMSSNEKIPFLKPLQHVTETEISAAERDWSEWLAMQDWMVGPRAPDIMDQGPRASPSPRIKRERE